jgi:hypothetical protein
LATQADTHPIRLVVTDDLRRSRLTVFFRLLLAIPHLIVVSVWGIVFFVVAFVNWFVLLFAGRTPEGMHNFQASFLIYSTRVTAYINLIADPFPGFGSGGSYPVDLVVAGPERHNRWKTGFRAILAIPALIFGSVLQQLMQVLAFVGWFVCLAIGRMPEGIRDLQAFCLRYSQQANGYFFLLTDRYPSLAGGPTA